MTQFKFLTVEWTVADGRKHGGRKTRTRSTERGVDQTGQTRENKQLARGVRPPSWLMEVPLISETMAGSKSGVQWGLRTQGPGTAACWRLLQRLP